MRNRRLTILLITTAITLLPVISHAGHRGSGNNDWPEQYARIAVDQANKNYRRGCGYSGGRWTSNYNDHRRWAARNPVHKGEREIRRRDDMLRNCQQQYSDRGRHDNGRDRHNNGRDRHDNSRGWNNSYAQGGNDSRSGFADYYARTAVKQARQNLERGCGYHGERWTTDYNRHYRYGYKTRRYRAESEMDVRERMLNECHGGGRRH